MYISYIHEKYFIQNVTVDDLTNCTWGLFTIEARVNPIAVVEAFAKTTEGPVIPLINIQGGVTTKLEFDPLLVVMVADPLLIEFITLFIIFPTPLALTLVPAIKGENVKLVNVVPVKFTVKLPTPWILMGIFKLLTKILQLIIAKFHVVRGGIPVVTRPPIPLDSTLKSTSMIEETMLLVAVNMKKSVLVTRIDCVHPTISPWQWEHACNLFPRH
jgi:hypothetical protein